MGRKYSQSASWTREIWALAVFFGGYALHDWRSDGGERLLALMLMLGAGMFLCAALVERMFFLPRIHRKENHPDSAELMKGDGETRNEVVNYDGPRMPRAFSPSGESAYDSAPDGLDPVPPPRYPYLAETEPESPPKQPEPPEEDDHEFHADMHSALSDPFFGGEKK